MGVNSPEMPLEPATHSVGAALPQFKRTEAGILPKDWDVQPICALSVTGSGTTPPRELASRYFHNGTVNWLKTLDLNNSVIRRTEERITPIAVVERGLRVYPLGSVIVAMYGGFAQIGRTGMLAIESTINQALTAITPNTNRLVPRFLLEVLNYRVGYWRLVASSSRRDPNITGRNVREFRLPVPPVAEQRAIAEALSDADGLLGALDALIAKKRAIKQATMQQLLTGKTRLPGFSGEWEMKRLDDLAVVDPENLSSATDPGFSFNYISLEQVDGGRLLGVSEEVFRTAPSRARRVLRHDDVLMSTVRPNLMAHLRFRSQVPKAVCSTGFAVLRAKPGSSDAGFLFAHLFGDVVNNRIKRILAGSNYPAISSGDVRMIEIPCPSSVAEQTAIAAVLSDMDAEIAALQARREKTRAIKQGMMQQLLTGRIRLVKPEPAPTAA